MNNRDAQRQIIFQALLDAGRDEYNARKDSFVICEAKSDLSRFVSLQLALTTNKNGKPKSEAVDAILQQAGFTSAVAS